MDNLHIELIAKGDTATLLQGKAPENIEAKAFAYLGNIATVATWLETKKDDIDLIHAVVSINYKEGKISLDLNVGQENKRRESGVRGKLKSFADLEAFHINTNYGWQLTDLGNFCKFNRRYFLDKSANMDIVSGLKSFKAQASRDIEKTADDRGNHRKLDDKRVTTTLPEVFTLVMPLFEGEPTTDFDVELLIEEKEGVVRVMLQSVSLLEKRETYIRQAIDVEVEKFKPSGITIIYE